ncbi:MAG: exodeoxyribonuclease III [Nannocystaceae bacterium]
MPTPFSLVTWNVNSVRARLDNVLTYLDEHDPDVVCLQETKVENRSFPKVPFMEMGYQVALHGTGGRAGVATLTKVEAMDVVRGFRVGEADAHPRVLSCLVAGIRIYNLYVPNGQAIGTEAFAYKLAWFARLRAELEREADGRPVLLCGDFNIAPEDADVWSVAAMRGSTHVTLEERGQLEQLRVLGLSDCFLKPDCFRERGGVSGRFTWFDYRGNAWPKRQGLRIDHVYVTRALLDRCVSLVHDYEPRGWETPSDHVPVRACFDGPPP